MTVASVDSETGRTVLISLPRNLQAVPFPSYSPLHDRFPNGYRCSDGSCMLNAIYTYASEHRDLYPGVQNPGAQATKEAVEGATGLKINYWVLIDLEGFESLVDSVGGITMDVYRRVPIGGGSTKISGYVEAGKNQHLTGFEALWFARSRVDSSDYDRVLRQKCVMRAMLNQFDPITVLMKFNKIAAASREVVATDIPTSEVGTMIDLALKAKALPVSSVAMMPPLIHPSLRTLTGYVAPFRRRSRSPRPSTVRWPNQRRPALRAPRPSPNRRPLRPRMRRPTIWQRSVQSDFELLAHRALEIRLLRRRSQRKERLRSLRLHCSLRSLRLALWWPLPSSLTRRRKTCLLARSSRTAARQPGSARRARDFRRSQLMKG